MKIWRFTKDLKAGTKKQL